MALLPDRSTNAPATPSRSPTRDPRTSLSVTEPTDDISSGRAGDASSGDALAPRRSLRDLVEHRRPDRYGALLVLILGTMFAPVLGGASHLGAIVGVIIAGGMLLFALDTSVADPWIRRVGLVLTPVVVVAGAVTAGNQGSVATSVATAILVVAALASIARRLIRHHEISGATILGAVCVYLLLGLLFASVYAAFAAGGRAFAQHPGGTSLDAVYFSFITLATVGYGDLSPGTDIVRVLAMVEGLLGQLYLVTVIAVLVSNVGTRRRT